MTSELQRLAGGIVDALTDSEGEGWSWTSEYHENAVTLTGPDDVSLFLYTQPYQMAGRVRVSGNFRDIGHEYGDDAGAERAEMTAAMSRGGAAIARDIVRKILPTHRTDRAKVRENVARRTASADAQGALVAELVALMGGSTTSHSPERAYLPSRAKGYGHASVNHNASSVSFDLSYLSPDVARKIAAILADA